MPITTCSPRRSMGSCSSISDCIEYMIWFDWFINHSKQWLKGHGLLLLAGSHYLSLWPNMSPKGSGATAMPQILIFLYRSQGSEFRDKIHLRMANRVLCSLSKATSGWCAIANIIQVLQCWRKEPTHGWRSWGPGAGGGSRWVIGSWPGVWTAPT